MDSIYYGVIGIRLYAVLYVLLETAPVRTCLVGCRLPGRNSECNVGLVEGRAEILPGFCIFFFGYSVQVTVKVSELLFRVSV